MEHFGVLSLIPPFVAITLALVTKEVISSLTIGILSGLLIYNSGNVLKTFTDLFTLMSEEIAGGASVILFLSLMGALVSVVALSGGARSYGDWVSQRIKTKTGAIFATSALGILIFVDDYFNCVTVGTVMSPITDHHKISRAKLAYIIDATAAPVCTIAPISSIAAYAISVISNAGVGDGSIWLYMKTIPFNLYAITTIVMILFMAIKGWDYGKMAKAEAEANNGNLGILNESELAIKSGGKVYDLVIPIVSMIIITFVSLMATGGFFSGASISEAFGNADANMALTYGAAGAIVIAALLYLPRKIMRFQEFFEGMVDGVKSFTNALIILVLAWSIGTVCKDYVGTGVYVASLLSTVGSFIKLFPALIFVAAVVISFATGTSWGTIAMLVPTAVLVSQQHSEAFMIITCAAIISGSICGDHCSPISDTTIMSSTGANVSHITHVDTQLPYALQVAACSFLGFLGAGFTGSWIVALIISNASMILSCIYLHKRSQAKQ